MAQLESVIAALNSSDLSAADFVLTLLEDSALQKHPCVVSLVCNADRIISAFSKHPDSTIPTLAWANNAIKIQYSESIRQLAQTEEWHFNASHASTLSLDNFRIEDMALKMKQMAPDLWDILGVMLNGARKTETKDVDGDQVMGAEEEALWNGLPEFDLVDLDLGDEDEDMEFDENGSKVKGTMTAHKKAARIDAIWTIKRVVMISIMMQSRNSKCNALESIFGIFLHSTTTPEKVIQALAHMGISISISAIHTAIYSLSLETYETLREMGQTLLVGYAYDNFDIDFKVIVPTIEKAGDTLTHLTSGTVIMLEHGVTQNDLKCSQELWAKSPLNPLLERPPPIRTCFDLEKLHPEADHISGLTRRERFNMWKFCQDLFEYGPAYFKQFKTGFPFPDSIEQIPVVKMCYAPARSMDINQSTHAGNIGAMAQLLEQGGVGDSEDLESAEVVEKISRRAHTRQLISILEYTILFFGDLGTYERVQGVLLRRCIEATPGRRYQFVVFIMGLFHLKMACADAVWRIFIEPKRAKEDANCLMSFVATHRPRETGKISSNPGFRRMHEVICHNGTALRLDAWSTELQRRNSLWTSLDVFAESKPTQQIIEDIAKSLVTNYVAGGDVDIYNVRNQPTAERDEQHENILLMHQYFLIYEEITFAMNQGDVGRVETLFPPWINLFKATGKHKYSAHMVSFLTDIHYVYPEKLKHAVRYNMLVNPTGKPGKFRGVDWVEEQMINLYTKHTFGGGGSNYTKARVIEESTLIKIYHSCHDNIERNFCLTDLTSRHAPPNMAKTFDAMAAYMRTTQPNQHQPGRKSTHCVPDMFDKGAHLVYNEGLRGIPEDEGVDQAMEDDDLAVEFS